MDGRVETPDVAGGSQERSPAQNVKGVQRAECIEALADAVQWSVAPDRRVFPGVESGQEQ